MHVRRGLELALLLPSLVACGERRQTFQDVGSICVSPPGPPTPYEREVELRAGEALEVTYLAPLCAVGPCVREAHAECQVRPSENGFLVRSRATSVEEGSACPEICGKLTAVCLTPPLAEGTYVFTHGKDQVTVTVPSRTRTPCTNREP